MQDKLEHTLIHAYHSGNMSHSISFQLLPQTIKNKTEASLP